MKDHDRHVALYLQFHKCRWKVNASRFHTPRSSASSSYRIHFFASARRKSNCKIDTPFRGTLYMLLHSLKCHMYRTNTRTHTHTCFMHINTSEQQQQQQNHVGAFFFVFVCGVLWMRRCWFFSVAARCTSAYDEIMITFELMSRA